MPSRSLLHWQTFRTPRLAAVEAQLAACSPAAAPRPDLLDENLRAAVLLLAAHFQGFCRDLHTEAVQVLVTASPAPLRTAIQAQCLAARKLDAGNATLANVRDDFERFGFDLQPLLALNPANALRVTQLDQLNKWRNYAAHDKTVPPAGPALTPAAVPAWRAACAGLAAELDAILHAHFLGLTGAPPW